MSFALWERIHGHLGLLAVILLVHPMILLFRGHTSRARRVAAPALVCLALSFGLGLWIYPHFREEVKPFMAVRAPAALYWFGVKEHLAWLCVCLAVGGAALLRAGVPETLVLAKVFLSLAALLGLWVAVLGVWVAAWPLL